MTYSSWPWKPTQADHPYSLFIGQVIFNKEHIGNCWPQLIKNVDTERETECVWSTSNYVKKWVKSLSSHLCVCAYTFDCVHDPCTFLLLLIKSAQITGNLCPLKDFDYTSLNRHAYTIKYLSCIGQVLYQLTVSCQCPNKVPGLHSFYKQSLLENTAQEEAEPEKSLWVSLF